MTLRMNPFTGQPEFIEETPTINEQTGQQANVAGQTATALTAPTTPAPVQATLSQPTFNVSKERRVEVPKLDEGFGTRDFDVLRDEVDASAVASRVEQLSVPSARELALDEDILRESQVLKDIQLRESQLADQLLTTEDFSEDRQVDIGTIRGEQAQAQRVASAKQRSLALEKQSQVNVLSSFLEQKSLLVDARTQQLQNTRENVSMLLQLAQATLPDVLQTEINKQTGEVTAIVRDPQTGQISTTVVGSISPEKAQFASNPKTFTNALGQVKVWYTDASGNLIVEDLDNNVRSGSDGEVEASDFKAAEFKAAGFAQRMVSAEEVLSKGFHAGLGEQGDDVSRRQFNQAAENFITAVLRPESGAAISDEEFAKAKSIYIPKFGDSETTLTQKARSRNEVTQKTILESGGAYEFLQAQSATPGGSFTSSSGNTYTLPNQ